MQNGSKHYLIKKADRTILHSPIELQQ